MRIILSPAKQMTDDEFTPGPEGLPVFLSRARELADYLLSLGYEGCKELWACNEKLAKQNYSRLERFDPEKNLTPAILAYDGIAFQYMAPGVFENGQFGYVQEHLRILSGLYGVLRPLDGVRPYRLEMQAKASPAGCRDLYEYWGRDIYAEVTRGDEGGLIVNLASKEYSRCVEKYLRPEDRYLTCVFAELENGKPVQKGVYAKMARGEMVRYMAECSASGSEDLKGFDRLGYSFDESRSDGNTFVFLK